MKIALDVMGTDYGPKELVLGAVQAVKEFNCEIVLVGDPETIENLLREYKADTDSRLSICPATEVVRMDEHPSIAVKTKKNSSIVVATRLLREKKCDALVSSGSTGAWGALKALSARLLQRRFRILSVLRCFWTAAPKLMPNRNTWCRAH